jgi:hypothetical protein
MNPPSQNQPRLLPFDRESPGAWQKWENFWVDFLNADPLLPWPGKPFRFKRSIAAVKWGVAGGSQDGIDMRADMEDGSVLAVQCKDWKTIDPAKAKKAMDKAEKNFKEAQAYFLVFTEKEISSDIQEEADRRGNWKVIGRDTLSSWFLSGKFLDLEAQKRLIKEHFDTIWLKKLFPQPWDDLLISRSQFFTPKNLIRHDAQLQGSKFKELAETLAAAIGEGNPRISILFAPGGQGKTRLLKATAQLVESSYPNRKIRFHNDSAGADAEDYGIRGADFKDLCLFIDDAHRLENVRKQLLKMVAESGTASVIIAARPNNIRALETRLEECGFRECDWQKFVVPFLDSVGRRALAVEILGSDDGKTPDFLAKESESCPLICTVGAELIRSGGIGPDVLKTDGFKRRVFDHLMGSWLDQLFSDDPDYRKTSELCLRAIALIAPISKTDKLADYLASVIDRKSVDVDPILSRLEEAGLLRTQRGSLRVIPDLLSDHLVYDTAYGASRNPSLVRNLMETPHASETAMFFANLAEAEWRARQEGKEDAFLESLWNGLRDMLRDPEDQRIYGLLNTWRKIAIFQPERTLELARILLDNESARVAAGIAEVRYEGFRYDSISLHLSKLPDLLAPVAMNHQDHRLETFDLLWEIGCIKDSSTKLQDEFPAAWQTIARAASLANWEKRGTQAAFDWLKLWIRNPKGKTVLEEGRSFLSNVASQWFGSGRNRRWRAVEAILESPKKIMKFQDEVLDWIESEIIDHGAGATWSVLPVIYAAGSMCAGDDKVRKPFLESPVERSKHLLRKVITLHDDPVVRLSVWQYLSKRFATEDLEERKDEWLTLRNSISLDLPFQLVRLASSFGIHEWNHERLQAWEKRKDHDLASQWWAELASVTVIELRRTFPSIRKSMEQLNVVNDSLARFRQRASWDSVAESWSKNFPNERSAVLMEISEYPEYALAPYLGCFLGLSDETDWNFAEIYTLRALSHTNARVRDAALRRLSWRDVKRIDTVAMKLRGMAASQDAQIVSSIVNFISWNRYGATPYFDETLAELNMDKLSTEELAVIGASMANLLEYTKHTLSSKLLGFYFRRLEREEADFQRIFPEQVMSVFHRKFPVEMLNVYLKRSEQARELPWTIDAWTLKGLAESDDFEALARVVLDKALKANDESFCQLRELFDAAVSRVSPNLAARLLAERIDEVQLERIIKLTGCGNGSVIYHVEEFIRMLLMKISEQPLPRAKELREKLIFCSVPNIWGIEGEEIEEEYLWARNHSVRLAEEFRDDPCLRDFFLDIVKNQEQLAANERLRIREDR